MSKQATDYLFDKIEEAINYARKEFDMTYSELIGTLEMVKSDIVVEARGTEDEG